MNTTYSTMAYIFENSDLVMSGFENGISDDPYRGINDMRGVNVISVPGEVSVSFSQTVVTSRLVGTIDSIDTGTETITGTVSVGQIQNYIAVQFTNSGGSLPNGISANTTYWVNFQTSSTFKIFDNCYLNGSPINITSSGSGTNTFTSIDMGEVRYFERTFGYLIDTNGRVWSPAIDSSSGSAVIRYTWMNNTITDASGNGLCVFKGKGASATKYLFVFRNGVVDYTTCADTLGIFSSIGTQETGITPNWQNAWKTLNTGTSINNPHEALVDVNNVMFFTDSSYIGSLREVPGATFNPGSAATYEWNITALAIPQFDIAQCLEQLNDRLLVGGLFNYVYSWNKTSTGFDTFQIAEKGSVRIITVNTNAYIFAGRRGRIFKTNGSQAELFKKVPDFLLGIDPIFTFYGVAYNKNQIYFGVSATTNSGTASTTYSGVWAVDVDSGALRVPSINSTSTATATAIFTLPASTVGYSLIVAWKTGSTYGIDVSSSSPYTEYGPYVDTEMVPIGQYLKRRTFDNIEFKLSAPLVSGEGIKLSWRSNLSSSFTEIGETTTAGAISDVYTPNFEGVQWIQLRIQQKSTASSPSFVRLTEVRLRSNPNNA